LEEINISTDKQHRVNDKIRAREIRLIGNEGEQLGVFSGKDALERAQQDGLDLVEISPNANPPVCRLMDYGKFIFEQKKKKAEAKKKQHIVHIKELKFRPGIEEEDYRVKTRKLINFIEKGDKVKISIRYRGREMAHSEIGIQLLKRIEKEVADIAVVEQAAKFEGRQAIMVVGPKKT